MPWISEDGRRLFITPVEALLLEALDVAHTCSECGNLHHEEFERWEEIEQLLRSHRVLTAPPA
jgi:hypothetical protein